MTADLKRLVTYLLDNIDDRNDSERNSLWRENLKKVESLDERAYRRLMHLLGTGQADKIATKLQEYVDHVLAPYGLPESYLDAILDKKTGTFIRYQFVPARFITDILATERFIIHSIEGRRGRLYRATSGYYRDDGEAFVLRKLHDVLGENYYPSVTRMQRLEILDSVRGAAFKYDEEIKDDTDWIPLKNGVINWRTQAFRAYDLERDYFFFQLPVDYDPSAKSPTIDKALLDAFDEDGIQAMIDYLAGCLVRLPMKDHLIAYGPPHTSKTTLTQLIIAFLGKDSVANCPLQKIARDRFASYVLENKMANVYNDIGKGAIRELGGINSATGMDTIWWERKGIDGHGFQPYAKHLYFTNELPRLDTEEMAGRDWELMAFFERFKVAKMQKSIFVDNPRPDTNERKRDRKILEKLTTPSELSGLLNRVLAEIPYVVEHGMRAPLSAKDSMMTYFRESDPAQAFVLDCLDFDSEREITKAALRVATHHYTDFYDLDQTTTKSIKRALDRAGIQDWYDDKWVNPRTHWWVGIKIKEKFLEDFAPPEKKAIEEGTREIKKRPTKEGENPQGSPGSSENLGAMPVKTPPVSPGLFHYLHKEIQESDVYNEESENTGGAGAESTGCRTLLSSNPGGALGQDSDGLAKLQVEMFKQQVADLQRRSCPNSCEHDIALLQDSIQFVADAVAHGGKPSAFHLRRYLNDMHPAHGTDAIRLVDIHYSEIERLGVLRHQIRKSGGQP